MIDHGFGFIAHNQDYAIIGSQSQAITCDIRHCDSRNTAPNRRMAERSVIQLEAEEIFDRLEALSLKQRELAGVLDLEENKITKVKSGIRRFTATEVAKANAWLDSVQGRGGYREETDTPDVDPQLGYLAVEILPSFAGMGGGGTGEGDYGQALVPRSLIEDELRAKPSDVLLIEARGASMEPDFHHGDQILIDKRDTNPVQPGAFALWDGDGYVVKLIERVPMQPGKYRVFSANGRFSAYEVDAEQIKIMGRPVWFGRRL